VRCFGRAVRYFANSSPRRHGRAPQLTNCDQVQRQRQPGTGKISTPPIYRKSIGWAVSLYDIGRGLARVGAR
jgi:hypothetical protein